MHAITLSRIINVSINTVRNSIRQKKVKAVCSQYAFRRAKLQDRFFITLGNSGCSRGLTESNLLFRRLLAAQSANTGYRVKHKATDRNADAHQIKRIVVILSDVVNSSCARQTTTVNARLTTLNIKLMIQIGPPNEPSQYDSIYVIILEFEEFIATI